MSKNFAWVAGEALIDLLPIGETKQATVGGGAANTARALANLGVNTSFIGGISTDEYGSAIEGELKGVDLSLASKSRLPTALAIVTFDSLGSAKYEFALKDTATFDFRREWLPSSTPGVLHVGTLATIIEPGASALFEWATELGVPTVFDPNVRPSVLADRDEYRRLVEKWAGISTIVKLSIEDLTWLAYSDVNHFYELGVKLVVLTHGASGIEGHTPNGVVSVPGIKVNVVDTVGAGDTVGAVLVEGIMKFGVEALLHEKLFEVLTRAAKAAAITCTRAGAKPPTLSELEA